MPASVDVSEAACAAGAAGSTPGGRDGVVMPASASGRSPNALRPRNSRLMLTASSNSALRLDDCVLPGLMAYDDLAVRGEMHHAGDDAIAVLVGDDMGVARLVSV
jgi:hypothetical protein